MNSNLGEAAHVSFHQKLKIHFVAVTDKLKAEAKEAMDNLKAQYKMLKEATDPRTWDKFIYGAKIKVDDKYRDGTFLLLLDEDNMARLGGIT